MNARFFVKIPISSFLGERNRLLCTKTLFHPALSHLLVVLEFANSETSLTLVDANPQSSLFLPSAND